MALAGTAESLVGTAESLAARALGLRERVPKIAASPTDAKKRVSLVRSSRSLKW